jgi:hypothetical protein
MLLSGAVCGGFCIVLSITGVVVTQIALGEVDRNNRLGLSQDGFYAISGWAFLSYDLIHIYVIGVFACWLVRSLCWEAWVGGSALIVSGLADCASLGVNIFLLTPALNAYVNGTSAGLPHPEAGYDLICSTLDFAQASFALVGSFFLAGAAMKAGGRARLAAWSIGLGFVTSVFQIAEVGLHTSWTDLVDDWLTPVTEILQHLSITVCLWGLYRLSWHDSRSTKKMSQKAALV